jgi:hypothetical protein
MFPTLKAEFPAGFEEYMIRCTCRHRFDGAGVVSSAGKICEVKVFIFVYVTY